MYLISFALIELFDNLPLLSNETLHCLKSTVPKGFKFVSHSNAAVRGGGTLQNNDLRLLSFPSWLHGSLLSPKPLREHILKVYHSVLSPDEAARRPGVAKAADSFLRLFSSVHYL